MKTFLFIIPALFVSIMTLSQGDCSNIGTISSSMARPAGVQIASSTCSTLVIKWQGTAGQSYCVTGSYFDTTTKQKQTLNATPSCTENQSCTATLSVPSGAQLIIRVQAITSSSASYPVILVLENPIPECSTPGSSVFFCGRVLLQGAYDSTTQKMRNDLNRLGILKAHAQSQPYNTAPFNYSGTETVHDTFFAAHTEIVDWVLIELRDANASAAVVAARAAFVRQDGSLVDTNGTNRQIRFPGVAPGMYHLAVRHRNHLSVRTSYPVDLRCSDNCYDFTTASVRSFRNQEYGSQAQVTSVWTTRGGNAFVDKETRYIGPFDDRNQILTGKLGGSLSRILTGVYAPEDLNMDGVIKWVGPGNGQNFLLNFIFKGKLSGNFKEQL